MAITIANVAYIFGLLGLPLLCKKMPRRLIFVLAMVGFTLTNLLLGPSNILGLPFVSWPVFLSFFLQGIFMVLIYVPSIPEMSERLYCEFDIDMVRDTETIDQLNDKVFDVYSLSIATSAMVSPFIGSGLHQAFSVDVGKEALKCSQPEIGSTLEQACRNKQIGGIGFESPITQASDWSAIFTLILVFILAIGNCGISVFRENNDFKKLQAKHLRKFRGSKDKTRQSSSLSTAYPIPYVPGHLKLCSKPEQQKMDKFAFYKAQLKQKNIDTGNKEEFDFV